MPYVESFDSDNNADLYRNTGNGTIAWQSTGGWNDSGHVKITPGTNSDQYYCIGQVTGIGDGAENIIHVRWLQYFTADCVSYQPEYKNFIALWNGTGSNDRPMLIFTNRGHDSWFGDLGPFSGHDNDAGTYEFGSAYSPPPDVEYADGSGDSV